MLVEEGVQGGGGLIDLRLIVAPAIITRGIAGRTIGIAGLEGAFGAPAEVTEVFEEGWHRGDGEEEWFRVGSERRTPFGSRVHSDDFVRLSEQRRSRMCRSS